MRIDGVSTSTVNPAPVENNTETTKVKNEQNNKEFNQAEVSLPGQKKVKEDEIIKAIESANDSIQTYNRKLQFSIHEKTKEIMVKVVDSKTDEVIREIPPEKILDMVAKLWEMAGILVDEKV